MMGATMYGGPPGDGSERPWRSPLTYPASSETFETAALKLEIARLQKVINDGRQDAADKHAAMVMELSEALEQAGTLSSELRAERDARTIETEEAAIELHDARETIGRLNRELADARRERDEIAKETRAQDPVWAKLDALAHSLIGIDEALDRAEASPEPRASARRTAKRKRAADTRPPGPRSRKP
jgi:chromosome segregation ATPase